MSAFTAQEEGLLEDRALFVREESPFRGWNRLGHFAAWTVLSQNFRF